MTHKWYVNPFVLVALLSLGGFASAQEFSAMGIARDTAGHVVKSKEYRSGNKVRIDPQEAGASCNEQAYGIYDLAQRTTIQVRLCRKTYTQKPARRQELQMLAVGDSPCPAAAATDICKDEGSEILNGRTAEKWEIRQSIRGAGEPKDQTVLTRIWVDTKLHVWVKFEQTAGATLFASNELQDIHEGPQPASLFAIPAGLQIEQF